MRQVPRSLEGALGHLPFSADREHGLYELCLHRFHLLQCRL